MNNLGCSIDWKLAIDLLTASGTVGGAFFTYLAANTAKKAAKEAAKGVSLSHESLILNKDVALASYREKYLDEFFLLYEKLMKHKEAAYRTLSGYLDSDIQMRDAVNKLKDKVKPYKTAITRIDFQAINEAVNIIGIIYEAKNDKNSDYWTELNTLARNRLLNLTDVTDSISTTLKELEALECRGLVYKDEYNAYVYRMGYDSISRLVSRSIVLARSFIAWRRQTEICLDCAENSKTDTQSRACLILEAIVYCQIMADISGKDPKIWRDPEEVTT